MPVVAAIATVIGVGISAYSSYQQGKTQQTIAEYNAHQQEMDAANQLAALQSQAAIEERTAEQNLAIRQAEARAREINAQNLESYALGQDDVNRANLVKQRQDYARMQGEQRSAIAASGAVESAGTPLDLLAETASRIQQAQEEDFFAMEMKRQTIFSEAAQERLGGKLALAGATLDYNSSVSAAALTRASGDAAYRSGVQRAAITRLTGGSAARAGALEAGATLLSGVSNAYYKLS